MLGMRSMGWWICRRPSANWRPSSLEYPSVVLRLEAKMTKIIWMTDEESERRRCMSRSAI